MIKTIVLAGDRNYTTQLETTIKSILYHNRDVKIYILNQDIMPDWFRKPRKIARMLGSEIIDVKLPEQTVFQDWEKQDHISSIAYARFFIPEYVPEDKVLYLDSDLIVNTSLEKLFSIDLENRLLAAVKDTDGITFNTGVLLINNEKWRQEKLKERLIEQSVVTIKEVKEGGSKKWIKLPKVIYGYRIRPNSITTKEFSEEKLDVFKIFGKYDLFFKYESDRTKLLVEKIKYLHLNYHDIEFVPENNQYKQLYEQEKQKLLSKIADYESKTLISIIVPIYKVEKYLRQCLDSIQNQTYQNFECLLINDGSPDNSADICREYVSKDARFRYFEKENGGVSSARNLGIECSGGGVHYFY